MTNVERAEANSVRSKFFNVLKRRRRPIAVVGLGLIVATGLFAYFDFRGFQDRAMREALEATATPLDFAILRAQQWTAEYAYGALILGGFGLVASIGSVAALIWTFREQRKLTQSESRAYLTAGRGEVAVNGTYGLMYRLWLKNYGNTPAEQVVFEGEVVVVEQKPGAPRGVAVETRAPIGFELNEIAAGAIVFGDLWAHDILDLPNGLKVSQGSHYRRMGTPIGTGAPEEDGVEEVLRISGKLSYFDVFDQKHVIDVSQWTYSLEDDGWLRGTGRMENFGHED
jgi:hypothetical protein